MYDGNLKKLITNLNEIFWMILKAWKQVVLFSLIGGIIGSVIALFTPVRFQSKITFVVEESKSSGAGLASLAGQFGFDFGSAMGGGVFAGDNILLFLKSEELCREVLLTKYDSTNKTLADKYIEVNGLKKKWEKHIVIDNLFFNTKQKNELTRPQDSLLQKIIYSILKTDLYVGKPDKKSTFIQVVATMNDEKLSYYFTNRLVDIATNKYIQSKTKVKLANVMMLQRRADSLSAILNDKTFIAASAQQELVDANPAIRTTPIASEISAREKNMVGTIFAEVVKNLELSKTVLSQETPAIQLVDVSHMPLPKVKASILWHFIFGGFLIGFIFIFYLLVRRWFQMVMH